MQTIAPVTDVQLLAPGQEPLMKVEILVDAVWVNLCDLDGKDYVKDVSVSLGGALMTPNPVGGSWNVEIANENGIFHPQHPTSAYKAYLQTERLTRISIGATYGGAPYYWQRIIGHMNVPEFNASDFSVTISGGDYMKRLEETEIKFPDNYWGASEAFTSIASDGIIGAQMYVEVDAMDTADDGTAPYDNVANWVATNCTFVSFADAGSPSTFFVGRVTGQGPRPVSINNPNVCAAVAGNSYQVKFWHRIVGGTGLIGIRIQIHQASGNCTQILYFPTDTWKEETFQFTALDTGVVQWRFILPPVVCDLRLDDFSISGYKFYYERYYDIADANEKGPYRVTLDTGAGAEDVWQAEEDEGWWYEEATGRTFFDINKVVAGGEPMVIYYYMTEPIEQMLADLLYQARVPDTTGALYANPAAVLAAIIAAPGYIDPAIDIDKAWFEPGTKCLNAVKKICERCDYRFYFRYDGTPIFRPKPGAHAADFVLTEQEHQQTVKTYQDQNEIRNRIAIEGLKQTSHINREETVSSQFKGELADDGVGGSIELYSERTLTIKNHLFQNQADLDQMCIDLLAEYKLPKWYADLEIPFNPVPLEFGDNIKWEERLSPILDITPSPEGIIRDIKIDNYGATYKCEKKE